MIISRNSFMHRSVYTCTHMHMFIYKNDYTMCHDKARNIASSHTESFNIETMYKTSWKSKDSIELQMSSSGKITYYIITSNVCISEYYSYLYIYIAPIYIYCNLHFCNCFLWSASCDTIFIDHVFLGYSTRSQLWTMRSRRLLGRSRMMVSRAPKLT